MATSRIASGITGGIARDCAAAVAERGRGEIGDERREVGARAGREGQSQPLLELVGIEPPGGRVRAQRLRHALPFGVRGECLVGHDA